MVGFFVGVRTPKRGSDSRSIVRAAGSAACIDASIARIHNATQNGTKTYEDLSLCRPQWRPEELQPCESKLLSALLSALSMAGG